MKTIKIIDLAVDLANGKEVPKKIRIFNTIFEYIKGLDYKAEDKDTYLFSNYILINKKDLNLEVEIIEDSSKEDKKIGKLDYFNSEEELDSINKIILFNNTIDKINEIIDKINGE